MSRKVTIEEALDRSVIEVDKQFNSLAAFSFETDQTNVEIRDFIKYSNQRTKYINEYERKLHDCSKQIKDQAKIFQENYISIMNKMNQEEFDLHHRYLNLLEYETLNNSQDTIISTKIKKLTDKISYYEDYYQQLSLQLKNITLILKSDVNYLLTGSIKTVMKDLSESNDKVIRSIEKISNLEIEKSNLISNSIRDTKLKFEKLLIQKNLIKKDVISTKMFNYDSNSALIQSKHIKIQNNYIYKDIHQLEWEIDSYKSKIYEKTNSINDKIHEITKIRKQTNEIKQKTKQYQHLDIHDYLIKHFMASYSEYEPPKFPIQEKENELSSINDKIRSEDAKASDLKLEIKKTIDEIKKIQSEIKYMNSELKSLNERISIQNDIETELNKHRMQVFNKSYSIPVKESFEMPTSFTIPPNCNEKLAELDELNTQIYNLTVQIDCIQNQTAKYIFTPLYSDKRLIALQKEVSYLESRIKQKKSFIETRKQEVAKADISLQRISEGCYLLICKNEHQMYSLLLNELQSWKYINVKEELNTLMSWMGNLNLNLV